MPLFLNSAKDYITKLINEGSENWAELMLSAIGSVLSKSPNSCFNLSGSEDFLSLTKIKTNISLLDAFYSIRDKFFGEISHDYKIIIETHYSDIWHALKLCESSVGSLKKVKSSIDLYDYKVNMAKSFRALERICTNVIRTPGFDDFKLESVIKIVEEGSHGNDEDSEKVYKKNMENLRAMKAKGFGTFADFVIKLKQVAEDSIKNLQENVENKCMVYIYNGKYNINFDKLGIKGNRLNKGGYYDDDERLLKNKIDNENKKKSGMYIKEIDKIYKLCISVHDKVKKLYYEVYYLWAELKLKCLEDIMEKLKKRLDSVHFFVFGADKCLCSEDKTIEDGGEDISSEFSIPAKGIFKLFCESTDDLNKKDEVKDVLYVKKMCENLKAIYKQIKYSEKSSGELNKTALKIKKECKNKMGKVKKLIARFASPDIPFWFASKIMRVGESCGESVKEAETLEKLTEALNEYIKYLERAYKFKKEILSKYIALEKIIKINKLDEKAEAIKKFAELKGKIGKLNLRENINFSNFKKLLNEAKKAVNEEVKRARKAAKKKPKTTNNSAQGSNQGS